MFVIIIWLAFAGVAGYMASNRNRSGLGWFLGSILLSPLITIIILFMIGENKEVLTEQGVKKLQDAIAEYTTLYMENEAVVSSNVMLKDAFEKFSALTVSKESTLTADEVSRYTDRLLNALPNTNSAQALPGMSNIEALDKLRSLRDDGIIDDEQFEAEKSKILGTT